MPVRTGDPVAPLLRAVATSAPDGGLLADLASACRACPLGTQRTRAVPGSFPAGARLLLVGEAPGAEEDRTGLPFVGRAGRLLDELLHGAGLSRERVAVANVLKCRPPGNRAPSRLEATRCRGWLDAQLALAAPRVVVTLGSTAAAWAFGPAARIAQLRGREHVRDGHLLLVTYHPSAALRFGPNGAPLAALRADLHRAAGLLDAAPARDAAPA